MKNNMDFESAMSELENVVKKLESGNASLNESIELYERGIALSTACNSMLDKAKQKIEVIKNENYKENEFEQLAGDNDEL